MRARAKGFGLLLALVLPLLILRPALASELSDYHWQQEQYRQQEASYLSAKTKYLNFRTLSAKKEVEIALFQLLKTRTQLLKTYFVWLNSLLKQNQGVIASEKARFGQILTSNIIWLDRQKAQLDQLTEPGLATLFEQSDYLADKQLEYYQLSYQLQTELLLGKLRQLRKQVEAATLRLQKQVDSWSASGGDATSSAAQGQKTMLAWLAEADQELYQATQSFEQIEALKSQLGKTSKPDQIVTQFVQIQNQLETARGQLLQAVRFDQEVVINLSKLQDE